MSEETYEEREARWKRDHEIFELIVNHPHNPYVNTPRGGGYGGTDPNAPEDARIKILLDICPALDPGLALDLAQTMSSENYHGHSHNAWSIFQLIPKLCPCLRKSDG